MVSRGRTCLSDAKILEHCMEYRPIPMKAANVLLKNENPTGAFGRKLKYHKSVSRPKTFDVYASSISRSHPELRGIIEREYPKMIHTLLHTNYNTRGTGNGTESTDLTTEDLDRMAEELYNEIDTPARSFLRRSYGFVGHLRRQTSGARDSDVASNPVIPRTSDSNGGYESNGNGTASTASDDGIRLPGDPRFGYESPVFPSSPGAGPSGVTDPAEYTSMVGEGYGDLVSPEELAILEQMLFQNQELERNPKNPIDSRLYM